MTKHNLKDHLNWLVKSTPRFPSNPPAAIVETRFGAASFLEPTPAVRSPKPQETQPVLPTEGPVNGNPRGGAEDTKFLRPSIPASVLNGNVGDALSMARLQSGTKSSNKPQLLCERLPTSVQPPLPAKQTPSLSLKDKYTAQYSRPLDGIMSHRV